MKAIGLIGGMSWESSVEYYRIINEEVRKQLGGLHSAKCLLYSVDFEEIERYQRDDEWNKAGELLGDLARSLEKAGADFIVICSNTMHKVVEDISRKTKVPILHIADATAQHIQESRVNRVGLLGTKYTMEQDFYTSRLESHDIKVLTPGKQDRDLINKVIFEELCVGKLRPSSKEYFKKVINSLVEDGAEAIILGCTEIGLLVKPEDVDVQLFDTTYIHAVEAVRMVLEN
ncbi:aspartate racemase [Salipaludibacillus neizhouensis]|uniref:Aspartate racemase n=1 Tax=Salipaludibacillus neizhouensis TaxID=885475 RepID=A0A3A9K7A3_9BACI|nr:aspartate/glutamate racemase family protein [Salipaludibacillus neizhouensis]RKL67358.1 aspartate racemase [Salipaludibacillus neizhouensis]